MLHQLMHQLMYPPIMFVWVTTGCIACLGVVRRVLGPRRELRVPSSLDGLRERLERIEAIVESTAIEVERISEANRFMSRLLAERGAALSPASRPERVITPH